MSRFDYFVVLAEMRTGSNFLEANLNRLDGVTCHGEAFNPSFIGHPKAEALLGLSLEEREADPFALLENIKQSDDMGGFRLFHNHDARIAKACINDPRCAKIILTRNPVDSFVSWKIAQATGQWKLTNATHAKSLPIAFQIDDFRAHLDSIGTFQQDVQRSLQVSGQTAFHIGYDDLKNVDVVNGIAAYLGVPARLDTINKKLKKQNPAPLHEKVTNFDEMQDALQSIDWFDMWRAPYFEPERGPSIPSYIAPAKSGLLYMPLRSGPDKAIKSWFARLDERDPQTQFSQRSLRHWFDTHIPHRRFAVLRHPIARAHTAFCTRILLQTDGRFAEIRANLRRVHKLPIPEHAPLLDATDGYDHEAHRSAFVSFLQFLKVNLSGQTSIRVDPAWASQHVLLQGLAQFAAPDFVFREEDLGDALPQLAAAIGVHNPPPFAAEHTDHDGWLAAIYDRHIEQAARDAYARDYQIFGFRDWA